MYSSVRRIRNFALQGIDGTIGVISRIFLDIAEWAIRYISADVHVGVAAKKRLLISPISVTRIDKRRDTLHVHLTLEKMRGSPPVDTEHGRLWEVDLCDYYGWKPYWTGTGTWGDTQNPRSLDHRQESIQPPAGDESRSPIVAFDELNDTYKMRINSREMFIVDVLFHESQWTVKYLAIAGNFRHTGKTILLDPVKAGVGHSSDRWSEINLSEKTKLEIRKGDA
jgi:hypothetical protein